MQSEDYHVLAVMRDSARTTLSEYRQQAREYSHRAVEAISHADRDRFFAEARRYHLLVDQMQVRVRTLTEQYRVALTRASQNLDTRVSQSQDATRIQNPIIAKSVPIKIPAKLPSDIPKEFICPITTDIMSDPVILTDGQVYDRKAIEKWLERSNKSPMTNAIIDKHTIIPCFVLRTLIEQFLENSGGSNVNTGNKEIRKCDKNTKAKKREPSKYNLYIKEQMPILKLQNPGMPAKELMKLIAAQWKLQPQPQQQQQSHDAAQM